MAVIARNQLACLASLPEELVDERDEFDGLEFEWDALKAEEVLHEHEIDFRDAMTVFADDLSATPGIVVRSLAGISRERKRGPGPKVVQSP